MKNDNFNKKITIILVCLIVILVAGLIVYAISEVNNKKTIEYERSKREAEVTNSLKYKGERLPEDVATPSKSYYFFSKYSGEISTINAYKAFYELAESAIPEFYRSLKNASQNDIKKYFNNNQESIIKLTGINTAEEFVSFMNKILNLKGQKIEFESYEFNMNTVESNKNTTSADLIIKYSGDNSLTINISLLENDKGKSLVKVNN